MSIFCKSLYSYLLLSNGQAGSKFSLTSKHQACLACKPQVMVSSEFIFDANEAAPWIKTFTGRITALSTDNAVLNERFYGDFGKMYRMYGGSDK